MKKKIIALFLSLVLLIPNSWVIYAMNIEREEISMGETLNHEVSNEKSVSENENKVEDSTTINDGTDSVPVSSTEVEGQSETIIAETSEYLYAINDDYIEITGYLGNGTDVIIPEQIEGIPVTRIDGEAFRDNVNIKSVSMPDSITYIEAGAFANCSELTEVSLSKKLANIEAHAFYNCDKITEIEIPKSLVKTETAYLYEYAGGFVYGPFYGCDGLKTITFEKGITTIANGLFANCPGIENVVIPDQLLVIQAIFHR